MAAMGRGGGRTPERVVTLIKEAVSQHGQNSTAKGIGIPLRSVQKYLEGTSEPTQASLQKIASFFGVSVAFLRGAQRSISDRLLEGVKARGIDPVTFNQQMTQIFNIGGNYWDLVVNDQVGFDNGEIVKQICESFKLNEYWLLTGGNPPPPQQAGFVGKIDAPGSLDVLGPYFVKEGVNSDFAVKLLLDSPKFKLLILTQLQDLIDKEMYSKKIIIPKDFILTKKPSAQELDAMSKVAACLFMLFGDVTSENISKAINKISARTVDNFNKRLKGEKPEAVDFPRLIGLTIKFNE